MLQIISVKTVALFILSTFVLLAIGLQRRVTSQPRVPAAVVPHHNVAQSITKAVLARIAQSETPRTVVLISPDHFDRTNALAATSGSHRLAQRLVAAGAVDDPDSVAKEHGIAVPAASITDQWPGAEIVPLVISTRAPPSFLDAIVQALGTAADEDTLFIASVDFSHYLPPAATAFHDRRSVSVLARGPLSAFPSLEVDSWQSLFLTRRLAELRHAPHFAVVDQSHTSELTNEYWEENTGYVGGIFTTDPNQPEVARAPTLLAVGDIMLARDVERLVKRRGDFYPFEVIHRLLWGNDITLGNLEGPIVNAPTATPAYSLRFSFGPKAAALLKAARFTAVSIANNHIADVGSEGIASTVRHLQVKGLDPVGSLAGDGGNFVAIEEVGLERIGIVGLADFPTSVRPEDWGPLVRQVAAATTFTVVSVHWGMEYTPSAHERQRHLARILMESGADVVLGHHPHVVQDIEVINGKPVFYSLGNFVFDQYHIAGANRSLAVGVEIGPVDVAYHLFPLILDEARPRLMDRAQAKIFLQQLSDRSDPDFSTSIQQGRLSVAR